MQTLQVEDDLAELEVVLLPRPKLLPSLGRSCIELQVLDLPVGLVVGHVIGLSACNFPGPGKGPPHCCGFGGDSPPIGSPPHDLLSTPYP